MAQLVKLQDYVSRYEKNLYHYQSLFMRIKENRYKLVKQNNEKMDQKTINKDFRKKLYDHQLNWATSTVKEISNWDTVYRQDQTLQFLTQEVPDNYFLLYEPVLQVKNAPVELDIILVGPADVWLLVWLDGEGIWQESNENKRFWKNVRSDDRETSLSPIIRLERMNSMLREYWEPYQKQLTLRQCIIAPHAFIDFSSDWRKISFMDTRNFKEWHNQLQQNPAPIKNQQLKFISDLLAYGVTNSIFRKDPLSNESEINFEGI